MSDGAADPLTRALATALGHVAEIYRRDPHLRESAELCSAARAVPAPASVRRLPVCRHLDRALALAEAGPLRGLAEALRALAPWLAWRQNPTYDEAAVGATFLRNYSYADLLGPNGLALHRDIAVGVLLLGPETLYPDHHHPAVETYHVLGGPGEFRRGDEDWRLVPPGGAVHHPTGMLHAMRTGTEPMLALYCWLGDLGTAARMEAAHAQATDVHAACLQVTVLGGELGIGWWLRWPLHGG